MFKNFVVPLRPATLTAILMSALSVFGAAAIAQTPLSAVISANPQTVVTGGAAKLTWASSGAGGCVASGAWSGKVPTSGSRTTGPLSANSTFNLLCGRGGLVVRTATTVAVLNAAPPAAPTLSFSGNPAIVPNGTSATLTWASTNADGCVASGSWSGNKATTGSQSTGPLAAASLFSLVCTGAGGSVSRSATVTTTVSTAPTVTLSALPASIVSGANAALNWWSTDATACIASGAWNGTRVTAGSENSSPLTAASNTFTLTCTGAGGSAAASALVLVTQPIPPPPPSAGYTTNFPASENPISEGGNWITGKTAGLDWNNPQTAPGKAYAAVRSGLGASRYDDSIATLNTAFTASQFAEASVYRAAGYSPGNAGHEVELLLHFQITAHNARGYEILWGHSGYLAIVRWNGGLGDYTALYDSGLPGIGVSVDGDVLRAEINNNVIKVYKNGALMAAVDTTSQGGPVWSDGQPGLAFWPVDSSTVELFGWKSFQAGNL